MKKIFLWFVTMVMIVLLAGCGSHPSVKNTHVDLPVINDDIDKDHNAQNSDLAAQPIEEDVHHSDDSFCQKESCVFSHEKLSELTLVGTMIGHHFQWAFLENASGITYKVEVGHWVGEQHEKVVKILSDTVALVNHEGQKNVLVFKE